MSEIAIPKENRGRTIMSLTILPIPVKICPKCKRELPFNSKYFGSRKDRNMGLHYQCKDCLKKYKKQYKKDNKDKIKEKNKKYREKNKEKIKIKNKEYNQKNKIKINEYQKQWRKENREKWNVIRNKCERKRRKTDPQFRLRCIFSSAISTALKERKTSKKGYSWEKILGYTTQDLMEHLESQFTEGMNWENYGKWHVDHIKPQSSFSFSSYEDNEFQECWALSNLQPLWSQDNLIKSNKIKI